MSVLAVLLLAVGVADLVRSALPRTRDGTTRRRALATGGGLLTLLLAAGLAGLLGRAGGATLTVVAGVTVVGWVLLSERALVTGRRHLVPLGMLGGGLALQLALSGWAPPADGLLVDWLGWARLPWVVEADRALLVAGLALAQLATGNLVVRLVLVSTGAMRAEPVDGDEPDEELRGGRLLGPLERLFILGLGLAGELTAAGLVVAAKGLIRWPELTAKTAPSRRRPDLGSTESDIDTVTEYFLVGSFVSWLLALSALLLAR